MTLSKTLRNYLTDQHAHYNLLKHRHATSTLDAAEKAHIPQAHLAKAVVLEDGNGHHLMAVVPSKHRLRLHWLNRKLGRTFHLVSEQKLRTLFDDCDLGAIPALGQAYAMDTICEEALLEQHCVYVEAGDHEALIKFERSEFQRLMANQRHERISSDSPTGDPYQDADRQ